MKKITIVSLLIIMIITLTGCTNSNENLKLKIKQTSWSGWVEEDNSSEKIEEFDVIKGKKYTFNSNSNLTFTITKITNNYIIIKTTEAFSDKKDEIDLTSKKTKFKINLDKELELATPQTDGGNNYYLLLTEEK
ncbi:MAG: hypothetical protein VZS44_01765 [Bacilli bacterium]|nr:hypothetical protein [Bacilli bacterium]